MAVGILVGKYCVRSKSKEHGTKMSSWFKSYPFTRRLSMTKQLSMILPHIVAEAVQLLKGELLLVLLLFLRELLEIKCKKLHALFSLLQWQFWVLGV